MSRCQTETSYLKSVLLWLKEYWTGAAVRIYPLSSLLKNLEIGALPVFLPWGLGRSDVVNRR
jgi:hypothetical protein